MLMVWILCNSWEVTTVRFLRKRSLRRIHCWECGLVSYDWSVPLFMYFSCTDAPTLLKSSPKKCLPESGTCLLRAVQILYAKPDPWADLRLLSRARAEQTLRKPNHVMLYPAFKHTSGRQARLERSDVCSLSWARQIISYCVVQAILLCRLWTYPASFDCLVSSVNGNASVSWKVRVGFRCGNVSLVIPVPYFVQLSMHIIPEPLDTMIMPRAFVLISECMYRVVLTCLVTFITCNLF